MNEREVYLKIKPMLEGMTEGIYWDFKKTLTDDVSEIMKDILAFSNSDYNGDSYIIVGVSETDSKDEITKIALTSDDRKRLNTDANYIYGLRFSENLSDWKKKYESDEVLVRVIAKHYNLLNFLRYDEKGNGKPEEQKPQDYDHKGQNDNDRHKYIATAMEACIAAVYIENGENEVIEIVKQWIEWIDESKS